MNRKISRREFLKQMVKLGVIGFGLGICGELLFGCSIKSKSISSGGMTDQAHGLIIFCNKSLGYYFFVVQQEAINRAAQSQSLNFEVNVADMDAKRQINQFESALSKKPLAIISDPVDSEGLNSAIQKANKFDIPIGLVDTPVSSGKVAITLTFDNFKAGVMAAHKVIELIKKKNGEPKGIVLNCYGYLASKAWRLRKDGFEQTIQEYPGITLLSRSTDGDLTKMHEITLETLIQYPNLDAVHSPSETPARGIYQALKEMSKLHPINNSQHVIFVTIDGEPLAHQWIKEGTLDASISQDPIAYGEICVEMLTKYVIKGTPVPIGEYRNEKFYWETSRILDSDNGPILILPPFEINRTNVDDERLWANIAYNDWGIKYQ